MKKFTFILMAITLSTFVFAQGVRNQVSVKAPMNSDKTDWYTYWEDDGSGYIGLGLWEAGEKLAMRYTPTQLATMLDANPKLTKVSIQAWDYVYESVPYNNFNFVLEIFEGGSYDEGTGEYTPGTSIYTQNIVGMQGWKDFVLTTPVNVDVTKDLMVSIAFTGATAFVHSHSPIPSASTFGNLYYDPAETVWYDVEFTGNAVNAWAIKLYIEDEAVYVENSDLAAGFVDNITAPPFNSVTTLSLTATQDLVLYPVMTNNGPDDTNGMVEIAITVDGVNAGGGSLDFSGENSLANGYFTTLTESGDFTVTAAELTELGLTGTFNVCLTLTYAGTDNVPGNNQACVAVTRAGTVNVETSMTSAISIFPNPANNVITVANAENENIVIINMLGEVVANINNASSNETINISNLANGTYFVRINGNVIKFNVVK